MSSIMGPFCYIFCRKVEENMDHLHWECRFASSMWNCFFHKFDFVLTCQRDVPLMIGEFLLYLPFKKMSFFVVCDGVHFVWNLWGRETIECLEVWIGTLLSFGPWWGSIFVIII